MLLLPWPPRRAWLMSYWIIISFLSGVAVSVLCSLFVSPQWFPLGLILALVLAPLGMLWPQTIPVMYNAWNRLARFYTRAARILLEGIVFYIIFVPVGCIASTVMLTRPSGNKSLWAPRCTLALSAYLHGHYSTTKVSRQTSWIASYLSWAVQPLNLWAVCLLPFLILLKILEPDEPRNFSTNIYTLF